MKTEIQKAKLKNERLEVEFKENFTEENYTNDVSKSCSQIVHADLKKALDMLKPHLVYLCEQLEMSEINKDSIEFFNPEDSLKNYVVTGFTIGGSDDAEGVTIVGQKLLKSGKVLNLVSPFTPFIGASIDDEYVFASELDLAVRAAKYEVEEYLFEGKFGQKQTSLDFDAPATEPVEKQKKGSKKKAKGFDAEEQSAESEEAHILEFAS